MGVIRITRNIGGKDITLETGRLAKQADGAVLVTSGKNAVLVTACVSDNVPEGTDFFPLTVNYIEKFYAAGKIPGGFLKREGKGTDKEILVSRLIDRPIRPLFPDNFLNEVQVIATVLSADPDYPPDVLGIIGASAALAISKIPLLMPVGAIRLSYINGEFVVNPSFAESEYANLEIVIAGTKEGITMVEGEANEADKSILLESLKIGQQYINEICDFISELVAQVNPVKMPIPEVEKKLSDELIKQIREYTIPKIREISINPDKSDRNEKVDALKKSILEYFNITEEMETYKEAKTLIDNIEVEIFREMALYESIRPDGRKFNEIRPISIEVDILDSVHGSALFTRGQTQSLGVVTLGSLDKSQMLDSIEGESSKRFMLHYNFPPFSTGDVKKSLAPSRREVGHGYLAERSIEPILPNEKDFPYAIRIVSEILESNGSSSMATVCSSTLSLMAAGVPIKAPVAGIAMGLIWDKEKNKYVILTDIQGLEDHHGDMDFKLAGTRKGITGFQMDVKTIGITNKIMEEAVNQAYEAINFILDKIESVFPEPRKELSQNAPKIKTIQISENDIGTVIGSGGKIIKKIMNDTNTTISIGDNGTVSISSKNVDMIDKAISIIEHLTKGFRRGEIVEGTITRIEDYGLFVELVPGSLGLLHRSKIKDKKSVYNFKIGDKIKVKIENIEDRGKISLAEE